MSLEKAIPVPDPSGPVLFQASGWVEPDPYPIKATALVDGVVAEVHALEGQAVREGDLLATLIEDDARLAWDAAAHNLEQRRAEEAAHHFEIPLVNALQAAATARLALEKAKLAEMEDTLKRLEGLAPEATSANDLVKARQAVGAQTAAQAAAAADETAARADVSRHQSRLRTFAARTASALTALAQAELAFERTRVRSPIDGIVLRLLVAPGQKRMLGMDSPDSATVAVLYDPESLQVRVDVPLADAAGLAVGQPARITCQLLPDTPLRGVVTRVVGEADLVRNTLQAKVRIADPSPRLRPEMLCRVEFFAAPRRAAAARPPGGHPATGARSGAASIAPASPARHALFVHASALRGAEGKRAEVWVCAADTRRAEARRVSLGPGIRGDYRQVLEGLRGGEWAIVSEVSGLRPGARVNPVLGGAP